jgi:hypothetical protein
MELRNNKKTLTYGLNERDGYKESEEENKQLIDICKAIGVLEFCSDDCSTNYLNSHL